MFLKVILVISVIIQFGAFFIAIRLIPKTKFNVAWISISIGFLLMALRRVSDLILVFQANDEARAFTIWITLVISIAMLIASFYIRKILELLNRLYTLQKKNEARVLSAIISTEENERKFFAKELHDGLGPILSTMKMSLSALDETKLSEANKEIVKRTEYAIDSAIITTKEISNHLNPQVLERFGLKKALQVFIDNIILVKGIDIKYMFKTENKRFPNKTEVILYRVVCELINNTIKHASASVVKIFIHLQKDSVTCYYEDNGIGFNTEEEREGMGLLNIQSRIKSINGIVNIESKHNEGVSVFISFPV